MGDAEERALRRIREALDLPTVGQDDLLHYGQAEAGPFGVSGEIGLEDFGALMVGNAGTIVAHFQESFGSVLLAGSNLNFSLLISGLDGVDQEIEERLPEQLFIGLDRDL